MPKKSHQTTAFVLYLLGGICLASVSPLYNHVLNQFTQSEPYFSIPVPLASASVPIRSDSNGKGYFGAPRDGNRRHKGIDILASVGTPVFASRSGRVTAAGWDRGYGFYVELAHPGGLFTRYAHLSQLNTHYGFWVNAGQLIGRTGKTGNAGDPRILPHLHFEIRSKMDALDPFKGLLRPLLRPA